MNGKKVVVGLSGGVDSSVAASMLIDQGYEVHGVYLECYNEPGCRTDQDKADALKLALKLNIPFEVLDFRREYREKVVEYFYREYEQGRTPNPDVMCNREIKFGIFYDWALRQVQGKPKYDYVATGHYARIVEVARPSSIKTIKYLQRAVDESKDQSYFLWQVPRDHLNHILFPLGEMLKSEVREIAKLKNLHIASKPDSMGICFIGEVNVSDLLKNKLGENPGNVIYRDKVVGTHRGLWFYTIGERGGFSLDKKTLKDMGMHPEKMEPLYVIGKNKNNNTLEVGEHELTMQAVVRVAKLELEKGDSGRKLYLRIRNLGELVEVKSLSSLSSSSSEAKIHLKKAVHGVAEGQSAVIYDESGKIQGGGIIAI